MRNIYWIICVVAIFLFFYFFILPHGNIDIYGTSPLTKIYLYLYFLIINCIFFYVNSIIIKKFLNSNYYIFLLFNLVLTILIIFGFNQNYLESFDILNFYSIFFVILLLSFLLFYTIQMLIKIIVTKWQKNYFVLLLPIVFVDLKQYSTYWILFFCIYIYLMFQVSTDDKV